jgi:hypothetical protein
MMNGGGDEDFVSAEKRDALIRPKKTRQLQASSRRCFQAMEIDPRYAWAGTFGDTKDSLLTSARCLGSKHVLCLMLRGQWH